MDQERITQLLKPFLSYQLSETELNNISMYIDVLLKWNQRINLTAVRKPEDIVTRHFGESLFAAQALFPSHVATGRPARPGEQSSAAREQLGSIGNAEPDVASNVSTVVDVGSGAGFPGLPLKIWAPGVRLILIESNNKKATFLKEVVRALGLDGVEVLPGRAEVFPAASADVVTLRAVERFENVLPIAAGLVKAGGRLALLIGSSQVDQAKAMLRHWNQQQPIPVPLSDKRILLVAKTRSSGEACRPDVP